MRSLSLMLLEPRAARKVAGRSSGRGTRLAPAGNGGNEEDAVALLERAGFAAEKADVFFVEVNVEELADLALIVAYVAREIGKAGRKLVQRFGNRGRATVNFRRAVGEAAEGGGDFDCDRHF